MFLQGRVGTQDKRYDLRLVSSTTVPTNSKNSQLSHRIAWFYAGSSLANAFGGLIGAGVLGNLDGNYGIAGWRWLFIIEGCITIGVSVLAA